jgi:hypothetical protein
MGFHHVTVFDLAALARQIARRVGVFPGAMTGDAARCRAVKKNYAPDGFTGALAAPRRRKTPESVPTDSRARHRRRAGSALDGATVRAIFDSDFGFADSLEGRREV